MEGEKKGNELLDKIDGGAICEFKIQACFPKVLAIKTRAICLSQAAAALERWTTVHMVVGGGISAKALWIPTQPRVCRRVKSTTKPACARVRKLGRNKW